MLKLLFALALIFLQDAPIAITSPQAGETLRGQINIAGNINVTNFASAELSFSYASDPTSTWFTIQTFSSPLPPTPGEIKGLGDELAVWDTSSLTDSDYTLRLRVYLLDGSFQEVLIPDLKLRNDISIPTGTPTLEPDSVPAPSLPTPTLVPVAVLPTYPTPTPLPVNPAALTTPSIYSNFTRGTATALMLFFVIGILLRLRSNK